MGVMDLVNQGSPMLVQGQNLETVKELIRSPERDDFVTVLDFPDAEVANSWSIAWQKCQKHHLKEKEDWLWMWAKTQVAIKGKRADKFSMTFARLIVPEAYGGSSVKNNPANNNNAHAQGNV